MHGSTGSEALASHLLHLSVLQLVTRSSPFTHSRTLPLYTLSDLLADYLGLLAKSAKDAAELSGRDKVSVWDVGKALEEFGLGDINDMKEELESGMNIEREEGVEDENDRLRELAGGLRGKSLITYYILGLFYLFVVFFTNKVIFFRQNSWNLNK